MRELLTALGSDVKPAGKDKWMARCPVHQDKDFAMQISIRPDNSVGAYCHACGANGLDLYKALGINLDELFGDKKRDIHDKPYLPNDLRKQYTVDKIVLDINDYDLSIGRTISYQDKKRVRLATARIRGIEEKYYI